MHETVRLVFIFDIIYRPPKLYYYSIK